jgi:2-aminoethylphosphonate-pyruvate transaminase
VILLNPGPVRLSQRVRRALLGPDLCHREPEFAALQERVRSQLLEVYGADPELWSPVLLAGSGTSAVEAMVASLVPREGFLLVLANGVYGERIERIARLQGIAHRSVRAPWDRACSGQELARVLRVHRDVSHVAVVHHETTTGRLNDLPSLAQVCRLAGVELLVDAVSSFGAEELDFECPQLAAVAGTSNKCLHSIPGLGFVLARRSALARGCAPPRTLSLDLLQHHADQERASTSFTPPIPAFYALCEALRELAESGGRAARRARYLALAERVASGLAALGIEPYLKGSESSAVLRSYRLPRALGYDTLHDELKKRGFIVYAGQGSLGDEVFRISTMGEIADQDIERLLRAFAEIVCTEGRTTR